MGNWIRGGLDLQNRSAHMFAPNLRQNLGRSLKTCVRLSKGTSRTLF